MPDVGVLSLQIEENSQGAYAGLDKLVDVLTRVKNAVSGGLKLGNVASGLKKIGDVVNESISGSTIVKIGQLADELSKLKGLENVNIRINTGTSVESIRGAVQETRETLGNIGTDFKEVDERVVETTNAMTGLKEEMQQFDPSKLPLSSLGKTLDEASEGVNNNIDMVKKSFETLGYYGVFDKMSESVQEAGESVNAIIPYHENLENTWERITARMADAKEQAQEAVTVEPANGIAMYSSIEEAAKAMGITIEEANAKVRASHELVYGVPYPEVRGFNTIEEAAKAMGITADEARQRVHMAVEEAASPVQEAAFESVGEGATRAERMVELLREKIQILRNEVETGTTENGNILSDKTIISNRIQIENLTEKVEKLQEKIRAGQDIGGSGVVDALGDFTKIDLMTMKYDALRDALARDIDANRLDGQQIASRMIQINALKDEIESMKQEQEDATKSTFSLRDSFKELKDKISHLGISNLIKQFTRLARMRALRAIIRQIAAGFREGVENVYNYSKAVGTSFAPSMDAATSSLLQMKNSIGAAVAPALQAMIPVMQTIVSWLITGINYLNQFLALLNGQSTWTRALPATASAFDKQKKAAKGAGSAIKDLLADWDELNIIQSDSGGGGGGGADMGESYLEMFEQVGRFDNGIKKAASFIKDNMQDVLGLVKKAGAALLGWKFSSMFTGVLGTLGALVAAGEVLTISWKLTEMFDEKYLEDHDEGWLVADALTNLLGATLAGGIVGKVLGGGVGLVTAGIEMAVSGGISYGISLADEEGDKANALKTLGIIKGIIGDALVAAGFSIVAGPAGLLLGAAAGAVMFTVAATVAVVVKQYRTAEEIAKEAFAETGQNGIKVDEIYKALQDELTSASEGYTLVVEAFSGANQLKTDLADAFATITGLSSVVRGDGKLTQKEAEEFNKAWTTVFDSFKGLTEKSFDTIFAGLNLSLQQENATLREEAKQLRVTMLTINENLTQAEAEFRMEQMELADKIGKGKASKEEIDKYFDNLELMAQVSKTAMSDLDDVLEGGRKIDFGDRDNAVGGAVKFINDAADAAKAATDEIEAGYKAEMESLNDAWRAVEFAHKYGQIDDVTYKWYKETFDRTRENFKNTADSEKGKVKETVNETYMSVLEQALGGIKNIPDIIDEYGNFDDLKLTAYLMEIMHPIMAAASDAGAEFSEDFGKMFGQGISTEDWIKEGWRDKLLDYIRQNVFGMEPESEIDGMEIDMPIEVVPYVTLSDVQLENRITDALWDADGDISKELLEGLGSEYGLDLQGVLDHVRTEELMDENVTRLRELVDEINRANGMDLKLPEADASDAAKNTSDIAGSYESMASRIKAAISSLDGIGFNFAAGGMSGFISAIIPHIGMAATGAFVRSGDLVMANENGNFEMMGRMGSQPVIANNRQIVDGISQGVGNANENVVSELRTLSNLMQRMLHKEFVARAVPGSKWGRSNEQSADAYNRVTG